MNVFWLKILRWHVSSQKFPSRKRRRKIIRKNLKGLILTKNFVLNIFELISGLIFVPGPSPDDTSTERGVLSNATQKPMLVARPAMLYTPKKK